MCRHQDENDGKSNTMGCYRPSFYYRKCRYLLNLCVCAHCGGRAILYHHWRDATPYFGARYELYSIGINAPGEAHLSKSKNLDCESWRGFGRKKCKNEGAAPHPQYGRAWRVLQRRLIPTCRRACRLVDCKSTLKCCVGKHT